MDIAVTLLSEKKRELSEELERLQERVKAVKQSVKSIDDAIFKLGAMTDSVIIGSKSLKELVEELVCTQDGGLTPKEVADSLTVNGRPTSSQSVSSTLSRLKDEGSVDSTASGKWIKKITPPPQGDGAMSVGPVDGSRGQLRAVPPEGSIPSGSTKYRPAMDDDDEIPF
jgi:hypothetical protein